MPFLTRVSNLDVAVNVMLSFIYFLIKIWVGLLYTEHMAMILTCPHRVVGNSTSDLALHISEKTFLIFTISVPQVFNHCLISSGLLLRISLQKTQQHITQPVIRKSNLGPHVQHLC